MAGSGGSATVSPMFLLKYHKSNGHAKSKCCKPFLGRSSRVDFKKLHILPPPFVNSDRWAKAAY